VDGKGKEGALITGQKDEVVQGARTFPVNLYELEALFQDDHKRQYF